MTDESAAALERLRAAKAALDENAAAEQAAGVTTETGEFQRLNREVLAAEQAAKAAGASWWARQRTLGYLP